MAFMAVLESDLRALSAEARRRYPAVKDGAEHAILKLRSLSSSSEIVHNEDILRIFLMACEVRTVKLSVIGLSCLQKLISHDVVAPSALKEILSTLKDHADMADESVQLKTLQTILIIFQSRLHPETEPGMTMQSTKFSRSSKEGRGDASVWTDTPSDRAQKAKMNYLEAYNEASALASNEEQNKGKSSEAELVDKYNKEKRSKSLLQKHHEEASGRSKKKSKQKPEKEEWAGQHPWKPWDREKDLTAGRKNINLDPENMAQGLTSRFSSGSFQRNFL